MADTLPDIPNRLKTLHKLYNNASNDIFLSKNVNQILQFTKKRKELRHLTHAEIIAYQEQIEALSRDRERRVCKEGM